MSEKHVKYFGCRLVQRSAEETFPFFTFYAPAKEIEKWVGIRRVSDVAKGNQRILRKTRANAIKRFLGANSINTIPNNLLIAFSPETATFTELPGPVRKGRSKVDMSNRCDGQLKWGYISFSYIEGAPEQDRPALIVDGQHRLYGVKDFHTENLPLLVVGILDSTREEEAFQFIVVNNKAVRVPTDNVKSIIADTEELEGALIKRLELAGVKYGKASPLLRDVNDSEASPFYHLLSWEYNRVGQQVVQVTAIEQSMRTIQSNFEVLLRDDEDSALEVFYSIWRPLSKKYAEIWVPGSRFLDKVNILAVNEYAVDHLRTLWAMELCDIFESDAVSKAILKVFADVPQKFWEEEWTVRVQDNANVRSLIKNDLRTIVENSRLSKNWYEELKLVKLA